MESRLVEKGEQIYKRNKEKWEREYGGKIVAIEVDKEKIAGVGDGLEEAWKHAREKYPGSKFYFRKVGSCAATSHLY